MKKQLLYYSFLFFSIGCSAGKTPIAELKNPKKILVSDYSIKFDKIITTNFTASGTLRIEKKGDYLILFDGHVSSLALSCLDYSTGKEVWKAPQSVWRYYFKDGMLVMQYDKGIEIVEIPTGKSVFKLNDCNIRWAHPEGSELANQIWVVYKEKDAVLDLKKMEIISNDTRGTYATYTRQKTNGTKEVLGGYVQDDYNLGENFLSAYVVEDETGNQLIFIWSLNDSSRTYNLSIYDKSNKKLKEHRWTIPVAKYKDEWGRAFSGTAEPEKLEPSTRVIGNQFFIFEDYTRYRWSWGQGNNRLTCIDLKTLEIKYQLWGQGPEDKNFQTFLFFTDLILQSNSTMHFQMGDGIYKRFDMENGKILDSLQQRFTLFKEYIPGMLIGFNHHRDLVKGDIYTNSVTITVWDHITNQYSKSFNFDFKDQFPYEPYVAVDGTIIFTYYDDKLGKSILYCCKVIPKTN